MLDVLPELLPDVVPDLFIDAMDIADSWMK
jgi:hypothetical protein